MPLNNQTIELPSRDPGHLIIALNSGMIPPTPSRGGFNQAYQDVQPLWVALNDRLTGNHFLALAAMFSEYMRVLEASFSHDQVGVNNEQSQALRNHANAIMCDLRHTAAEYRHGGNAASSGTGCNDIVSSPG